MPARRRSSSPEYPHLLSDPSYLTRSRSKRARATLRRPVRQRSTPTPSRRCGGARSVRFAAAGRRRPPACRRSRTSSTSARSTAASGRPPTTAARGQPIFDDQPTGSIGASPSRRRIPTLFTSGSGEGLAAAGSFGRRRRLQIDRCRQDLDASRPARRPADPADRVDPRDAEPAVRRGARSSVRTQRRARRLSGRPTAGRPSRRCSTRTRTPAASDVEIDPSNPDVVYAALWEARQGPWENGAWTGTTAASSNRPTAARHWQPADAGAAARASSRRIWRSRRAIRSRLYASVASRGGVAIYRSTTPATTGRASPTDPRPAARIGGGDLSVPTVDPKNPDVVYVASTS